MLEQSNQTITFLPTGKKRPTFICKRDIGNTAEVANKPCCSREAAKQDWRYANKVATPSEWSDSTDQSIEFEPSTTSTNENPPKQTTLPKQQKKRQAIEELKVEGDQSKRREKDTKNVKTTNNLRDRIRQRRRTEYSSETHTKQNNDGTRNECRKRNRIDKGNQLNRPQPDE